MAEAIQIGEVVKFAELAWRLYELGWSDDFRADVQYRQFGQDVRYLAQSLERLENVINQARLEFQNHGEVLPDTLGWDRHSLVEIIGDYHSTLCDCKLLLQENQSYNATTGPGGNIYWNLFVQPRVQSLRQRILLHNSKIEHVLQPFKIDLTLRIHNALARSMEALHQQMQAMHHDVQTLLQNQQALMNAFDPNLLATPEGSGESEIHQVPIPDFVLAGLEELYWNHPSSGNGGFVAPPLRDIADAFVRSFEASTRTYDVDDFNWEPSEDQYLNLLTCQFLMAKMLESDEYLHAHELSHWPSYVQNLQRELSDECLRVAQSMAVPQISDETPLIPIWPVEEAPAPLDDVVIQRPMELLLDMELETDTEHRWRKITLYRLLESQDKKFRLVITAGYLGQPASQTIPVNIDMSIASLVPQYATPDGAQPLVLILNDGRDHMHRLAFRDKGELYLFQQALTGYEVVDSYMKYQLQVIFVMGNGQMVKENASLQLWWPRRIEGDRITSSSSDSGSTRRASNSTGSSGGNVPEHQRSLSTPDLEQRMRRMSLNSLSGDPVMSGARNSNGRPAASTTSPSSPIPISSSTRNQANGLGGVNYLNAQINQSPTSRHMPARTFSTASIPAGQSSLNSQIGQTSTRDRAAQPERSSPEGTNGVASVLNGQRRQSSTANRATPARQKSQRSQPMAPNLATSPASRYPNAQINQLSTSNHTASRGTPPTSQGPAPGIFATSSYLSAQINQPSMQTPRRASSSSSLGSNAAPAPSNPPISRGGPNIPLRTTSQASRPPPNGNTSGVPPSPTAANPRHNSYSEHWSPRSTLPPVDEDTIPATASPTTFTPTNPFPFSASPSPYPFQPSGHPSSRPPTASLFSTASRTSQRTVSIASRATTAPTGTLHTRPTPPLLVLFTQTLPPAQPQPHLLPSSTTKTNNIVAITLDSPTQIDYTACKCASSPLSCPVSSLKHQSNSPLTVARVPTLDVLPLSDPRRSERGSLSQRGVIRVSICFQSMDERREFSGTSCTCSKKTEGQLLQCLLREHGGRLGITKEMHRRAEVQWQRMRFDNLRDVVGVGE
ncbi:hypothetical protein B0T16DRAFT_411086 [Cercophora newfieldiana]|uniref:Uncharacterized protein n=1 Tax=Cercophora newfieldiana TaxID=92897 RepID=A0AA39Y3J5_9PEZI|nr:hypothetical protein B0T16DRAFT_411086 [Cercophora newfieldiana]